MEKVSGEKEAEPVCFKHTSTDRGLEYVAEKTSCSVFARNQVEPEVKDDATPDVEEGNGEKKAEPVCLKKTGGEDDDTTKDYFKQLQETSTDMHSHCIKNRARRAREYLAGNTVFGRKKEPEVKDDATPDVEEGNGEKKVEVEDGEQNAETGGEDANTTKDYFKQPQETSADTHWDCIKNRARRAKEDAVAVFGRKKDEPDMKDDLTPYVVEMLVEDILQPITRGPVVRGGKRPGKRQSSPKAPTPQDAVPIKVPSGMNNSSNNQDDDKKESDRGGFKPEEETDTTDLYGEIKDRLEKYRAQRKKEEEEKQEEEKEETDEVGKTLDILQREAGRMHSLHEEEMIQQLEALQRLTRAQKEREANEAERVKQLKVRDREQEEDRVKRLAKYTAGQQRGGEKEAAEKENGGERKVEVEDGEKKAEPVCFKKTGGEDADTTKDYLKQLQETSAGTHWDCIKNRARRAREYVAEKTSLVFVNNKVEPEVKDDATPDGEMETGGDKKVEVEDGEKKAEPVCFKKTGGEDASFFDTTKDYFKQLQETSADTHLDCIKNRARRAREYVAEKTSLVNGGERKVEVEDGEKKAEPVCFKKTGGEDFDTTKDYFKQLQETSAGTHWDCIKNRARRAREYVAEKTSLVFVNNKVEPEVKDDATPDGEEGAKPAAPAGGESH